MNASNGVKLRRFVVRQKIEQIIDTCKSNNIKIGVNDMTLNDSKNVYGDKKNEAWSTPEISVLK